MMWFSTPPLSVVEKIYAGNCGSLFCLRVFVSVQYLYSIYIFNLFQLEEVRKDCRWFAAFCIRCRLKATSTYNCGAGTAFHSLRGGRASFSSFFLFT